MRRVLMLAVLASALALPPVAGAQSNPFGPLPPAEAPPTETPEPVAEIDDGSLSTTTLLLIGGVVVLVFLGIGWYITRDARAHLTDADRRALAVGREEASGAERRKQSEAARKKARERAKRQKQARKKQRAR